ncbi:MAG TPA: hemerythrin domain-containing protein [Usitatibacter sp.]|nr:hemerythrin domain-containing protein [Usitatibacter sp.]
MDSPDDDIRAQLRGDHDAYLAELESLRRESDPRRCSARLAGLRRAWAIHALAEESVVYRALETAEAASQLNIHADERFIEHELVEELFDKLARGRPVTLEWHARLKVVRELVSRHIEGEEHDVFSRLERQFGDDDMRRLAVEFGGERARLERLEEAKAA